MGDTMLGGIFGRRSIDAPGTGEILSPLLEHIRQTGLIRCPLPDAVQRRCPAGAISAPSRKSCAVDGPGMATSIYGDIYFTSVFSAWLDHQRRYDPKRHITTFASMLFLSASNMARFRKGYPDGWLISVIREPLGWYASVKQRSTGQDLVRPDGRCLFHQYVPRLSGKRDGSDCGTRFRRRESGRARRYLRRIDGNTSNYPLVRYARSHSNVMITTSLRWDVPRRTRESLYLRRPKTCQLFLNPARIVKISIKLKGPERRIESGIGCAAEQLDVT